MTDAEDVHPAGGADSPDLIVIEGAIGVGKSTLARRLAESFGYSLLLEQPEENPFLERFYRNPRQVALATQLYFLFQRTQALEGLRQTDLFEASGRVADYLIDKDRLFARVNLDEDEYTLYERVYQQLTIDAPTPSLVVYLQAPVDVLLQRIQQRGIPHERSIDRGYLERVNAAYSEFFLHYDAAPLLIVNAATIDLANSDRDYQQLMEVLQSIRGGRHYFNPAFL